ncbi:MAG TPA: glycine oxidase ThiO [Trebonia sp.]|nr:glycine oxidase ThiO [Trebonia sp.]
MTPDVLIVGGGVIGTAIAWRAAIDNGQQVTIVDPGADSDKASLVAAGMLGPVSESVFGEENLLNLNLLAIGRFPGFAAELEQETGQRTGLRTEGTLSVAYDKDDLAALRRLAAFRRGIGLETTELDSRECRRREPFLSSNVQGGLLATGDLSVDNRRYTRALTAAAAAAGVRTVPGKVASVTGGAVTLASGQVITARSVVVAAGWATSEIEGVPEAIRKAVRPVKGQLLRLRHPRDLPPIATHTLRALVQGRDIYIVPRADGELVVGATQEERDDTDATAGAVHDLLRDAMTALPAISELNLAEIDVGLRPGSVDNGPVVGPASPAGPAGPSDPASGGPPGDGLIVATGHFRNGILLSAATADAVAALLRGEAPAPQWAPFTPGRLA